MNSRLLLLSALTGFHIVTSKIMHGAKKAVKSGNVLYVSPAMHHLLLKEEGPALEKLLESIPIVDIGEYDFYKAGMLMER